MAQQLITEVAAEVLRDGGTTSVLTTEVAAEVLRSGGTTNVVVTEVAIEVLRSVAVAAPTARPIVCLIAY